MQALREGRSVKEEEGAIAYRVIRFKPKWRTEKVTFRTVLGWLSDKELTRLECKKSPNGRHKWEEIEEDRTRRTDFGCIPGTYCVHCGERKEEKKKA